MGTTRVKNFLKSKAVTEGLIFKYGSEKVICNQIIELYTLLKPKKEIWRKVLSKEMQKGEAPTIAFITHILKEYLEKETLQHIDSIRREINLDLQNSDKQAMRGRKWWEKKVLTTEMSEIMRQGERVPIHIKKILWELYTTRKQPWSQVPHNSELAYGHLSEHLFINESINKSPDAIRWIIHRYNPNSQKRQVLDLKIRQEIYSVREKKFPHKKWPIVQWNRYERVREEINEGHQLSLSKDRIKNIIIWYKQTKRKKQQGS